MRLGQPQAQAQSRPFRCGLMRCRELKFLEDSLRRHCLFLREKGGAMATDKGTLNEKTVDELREMAREKGVRGASDMRKDELVAALLRTDGGRAARPLRGWLRDRSLGIFFVALFLITWVGQLVAQWFSFVNEQQDHHEAALFWSG